MSVTRRDFAVASTFLLSAGLSGAGRARAAGEFDLKVGCDTPVEHPLTLRLNEAAETVREQTSGRLSLRVFPNSQLGGDTAMLSQVRTGALELLAAPSLTLTTIVPLSGLPSIGYAFQTYDQVWAAMDGAVGALVREAIAKVGLVPLETVWDNGFRQVTSSAQPITSPADLAGMKIRVPVTALLTSLFSGLGASPTSITFNEVYTALQTHIIDGQENPLALIETSKLYEVQKFCTLSNHCWSGFWMVGNRRAMAALPDEVRVVLERALNASALAGRADLAKMDTSMQAQLTKHGIAFNTPDPTPFQAKLKQAGFYRQWQQTYGVNAWQTLEQYSGKLS